MVHSFKTFLSDNLFNLTEFTVFTNTLKQKQSNRCTGRRDLPLLYWEGSWISAKLLRGKTKNLSLEIGIQMT